MRRWRGLVRTGEWLGMCGCVGLTGCLTEELVKSVIAENIALSAASAVQAVVNAVLNPLFTGLAT